MKNKSTCMLVSSIFATLYILTIGTILSSMISQTNGFIEELVLTTMMGLLSIHLVLLLIGTIFAYIATFANKSGLALAAAILFSISLFFMPPFLWDPFYLTPSITIIVTSYVGWNNIKKIKKGNHKDLTALHVALLIISCIIALIWIFMIVTYDLSEPTSTGYQDTQNTYSENSKIQQNQIHTINEPAIYEDTKLTVTNVQTSKGNSWDKPKEGMEYIIVTVAFENIGNEQISYNIWDFEMSNSLGHLSSESFTTINSDSSLSAGSLLPGGKKTGTIAFEQPKNDPNLVLYYKQNIFSDSPELTFKLN